MDGGRKAFYDQLFEEIAGLKMSKEPAVGGVFETVTSFEAIAESFPMLFVDIDTGEILYAAAAVPDELTAVILPASAIGILTPSYCVFTVATMLRWESTVPLPVPTGLVIERTPFVMVA